MAWIQSHSELKEHPKVKKAARILGVPKLLLIGHLQALWWWVIEYHPSGDLSYAMPEDIADAVEWEGDPQLFLKAMLECSTTGGFGFLEKKNGGLFVHDWDEHCCREYEKRKKDAERQKRNREKRRASADRPRDIRVTSGDGPRDVQGEKEKEIEKEIKDSPPTPPPGEGVGAADFLDEPGGKVECDEGAHPVKSPEHKGNGPKDCPHEAIIALYHDTLPELPKIRDWGKTARSYLRQRWQEKPERQNLDWWRDYFLSIRNMDWLMGRVEKRDGSPPFLADLEWTVRPQNMSKILNERYVRRGETAQPQDLTKEEKAELRSRFTNDEGICDERGLLLEYRRIKRERGLE